MQKSATKAKNVIINQIKMYLCSTILVFCHFMLMYGFYS